MKINKLSINAMKKIKELNKSIVLTILAVAIVPFMNSCQSPIGLGAATGAGIGALGGAVYSENKDDKIDSGKVLAGAAIGALAGTAAGAIAQHKAQPYRRSDVAYGGDSNRYGYNNQPSYNQPSYRNPAPQRYKVGTATGTRNIVRSPHRPYSNIDVTGFRRGEVVQDENGNPFIVP